MQGKIICTVLAVFVFTLIVHAQPKPPSKYEKLKHLKEVLELSDVQAKKIATVLTATEKKMRTLSDKMEDQRDVAMEEMDSIINEEDKGIIEILSDSQKEKYQDMKKEMESHGPPMDGDEPLLDRPQGPPPGR